MVETLPEEKKITKEFAGEMMKALVLAAGHGKRLLPYTHSAPKHMLPIANKPLLQYSIEQLANAGIKEIGLVVGYKKEQIMDYFGDGSKFGLKITYIEQKERLGISHAIQTAKSFVKNEPFVVLLGDNLFMDSLSELLAEHQKSGAEASIGIHEVEDPRAFGVAVIENGKIRKIIEKPEKPPSNLATVGIYFFSSPKVFDIIAAQKPSKRGEYEIADTLQAMIDHGFSVNPIKITKRWKDTGKKEDMLEANKTILEEQVNAKIDRSLIQKDSKIIAPCVIGKSCKIINSKIGPFVSIGDGCTIENASIKNAIIGENCQIDYSEKIVDSIIGKQSKLVKKDSKNISFSVGDNSEICETD